MNKFNYKYKPTRRSIYISTVLITVAAFVFFFLLAYGANGTSDNGFGQQADSLAEIKPEIVFVYDQSERVLTAVAKDNDIDSSSWYNSGVLTASPDSCQTIDYPNASNTVTFSAETQTAWLCFKVSDMSGNTTYSRYVLTSDVIGDEEPVATTTSLETTDEVVTTQVDEVVTTQVDEVVTTQVDEVIPDEIPPTDTDTASIEEVSINVEQTNGQLIASWQGQAYDREGQMLALEQVDYQTQWQVVLLKAGRSMSS